MSTSHYAHSSLTSLVESDSDDSQVFARETMATREITTENMPVKKARSGKAVATKVTKSTGPARRASGRKAIGTKARKALADKTNEQSVQSDTEEVDDFDQEDSTIKESLVSADELDASLVVEKPKRGRPPKSKSATKPTNATRVEKHAYKLGATQSNPIIKSKASSKEKPPQEPSQHNDTILETQESVMELDDKGDEEIEEPIIKPITHSTGDMRTAARPRQTSVPRWRAGSASDTERSDPTLRRKLGDLTQRFEKLDLRYRTLREIGVIEAENKFELLKKQSENSAKVASSLIGSLKEEIASQNVQLKEFQAQKKHQQKQDAEIAKLQAKVQQLTMSLSESTVENKTLSAKLAANRTAASSVESASVKAPGSAVKANGVIRMIGSAEAAQAAQIAQLKEDFYSDLTGLIVRGIKRDDEEDVYDCIQTGRNGTLHFKLAVANEKVTENYEDAQCVYIPQLDPSRDRDLIDMLPDYLVEEIDFPRPHAAKFYGRVVRALTEKDRSAVQPPGSEMS